ncbi:hypothetical protein NMY22_g15569 [Coprinellus aureogranulatus]|nr:hypothetical protein NMY22_g15569 [Coprinellus aureogranulatus]
MLEAGPRTLRPNAPSVLELIHLLGLNDQVITVPKSSPAAKARFLYVPPSHDASIAGLQRIPSSLLGLLRSPLSGILIPAVIQEAIKPNNRPSDVQDESVDSFLRRRFGDDFAQIFGSALIHGIYAADSRQIGIRSAFPTMWDAAERGWGSIVRGSLLPSGKPDQEEYETGNVPQIMSQASVYSFRDGLQSLTDAMEQYLAKQNNVKILCDSSISSVVPHGNAIEIAMEGMPSISTSHVVSALPTPRLHAVLSPSLRSTKLFGHLLANPMSSVHVVNIVFPGPPSSVHPAGFGYLIPRPAQGYPSSADPDSSILGTVFDSCSLSGQDTNSTGKVGYADAEFTKLTVMVGGPYPLPPLPPHLSSQENVSLPDYMQSILKQLSTHLSRPLPTPLYWRIQPNHNCIPTLLPGHQERMRELGGALSKEFGDKFQIVGAGVGGVSVGDCVEAGRKAALRLSRS